MQVTSSSTRNFGPHPDPWRFEATNTHVATRNRLQHYTVGKPVTSVMSLTGRARSKPSKSLESFDLLREPSCNERPVTVGGTQGFATIRLSLKATLTIILGISVKGTVIAEHQPTHWHIIWTCPPRAFLAAQFPDMSGLNLYIRLSVLAPSSVEVSGRILLVVLSHRRPDAELIPSTRVLFNSELVT